MCSSAYKVIGKLNKELEENQNITGYRPALDDEVYDEEEA